MFTRSFEDVLQAGTSDDITSYILNRFRRPRPPDFNSIVNDRDNDDRKYFQNLNWSQVRPASKSVVTFASCSLRS